MNAQRELLAFQLQEEAARLKRIQELANLQSRAEAAQAARSVEHRERTRKIADLKTTLREGAVYIEYHPIVVTETAEVYGYEALARG